MKQKITKDTVIVGNSFNAQCEIEEENERGLRFIHMIPPTYLADINFGGWENPQYKNEQFFEKPKPKYHK